MSERISILFPCREQKEEFLRESVGSVLTQSSPHWELLVGLEPGESDTVEFFEAVVDERVRLLPDCGPGFARTLNQLLGAARTPFVAILLSDDRYSRNAIQTLLKYRRKYPDADFFHSARRYIDAYGQPEGSLMPSRKSFSLEHFKQRGSPVKHLLCWRRELGLRIGGMDESLSLHGCDDFDFPWRMAEAGARFRAVKECLYEYRIHDAGPRLTTDTPLQVQIETLERMFSKHGATREETCAFLDHATDTYLPVAWVGRPSTSSDPAVKVHRYREGDPGAWPLFRDKGLHRKHFFPHRVYFLPRAGPDGVKLAQRMCRVFDPGALREVLLFAHPEAAAEFPPDLFFDDDLVWHQQQLGLQGQVATAGLAIAGQDMFVTVMYSDIVQRISRRRQYKTRVESVFKGWARLLLNAILEYALDSGLASVYVPTAELSMRHTDQLRAVEPALFERVYDRTVRALVHAERSGDWWKVNTRANEDRVVRLARRISVFEADRSVCVAHDIERGLGHRDVEPAFAAEADDRAPKALREMLAIEAELGVRCTYNVVGSLLEEVRQSITADGHALGFHSHAHVLPEEPTRWERMRTRLSLRSEDPIRAAIRGPDFQELVRCREIDYRVKGYRPPQSRIGPGLHDRHLAFFNFEWLASSSSSLAAERPFVETGIVKIPIHQDDFDLHTGELTFEAWEGRLLGLFETREIVVVSLHDCYAHHWLARYPALLENLDRLGTFRTFDEVANEVILAHTTWC